MSGVKIKIGFADLQALDIKIEALMGRLRDTESLMDEIGSYAATAARRRFETNIGPDDEEWTPSGRALAQSGRTLVDRGHLRDSVTHLASPTEAVIGSNVVYAAIHQFGGKAGRGLKTTMPSRPYLGLSVEDEAEIHDIVLDWMRGAVQ